MTTSPLIIPVARFFTISGGAALAGGKVYTYAAGTSTPKASYTDFGGLTPNTNPVILDSAGQANIWLDGNYKINLTDSNGVQQAGWPVDNVSSISSGGVSEYAVTTGSANTYVLAPAPAIVSYTAGTSFTVNINATNTGPSTINVSSLGTQALVVAPNYPLAGGELISGNIYRIVYDGTNFQVLNPTPPIDIIMSPQAIAPWGRLPMNGTVTIAGTSGGTYNGSIYARVYTFLWTNYTNAVAPVSTGRGANAAADFAANKNITIPDHADYIMLGVSAAGSITTAGTTAGASTVAGAGSVSGTISVNAVTLAQNNLPASMTFTVPGGAQAHTGTETRLAPGDNTSTSTSTVPFGNSGGGQSFTPTGSMSASFTGSATSVVQKSRGIYFYISY